MKFLDGLDAASQQIKHVGDGAAADDAATYGQLIALVNGAAWRVACRAATTGPINVSAVSSTIDTVVLAHGDRLLVKNQADATQNGIYVFNQAVSALARADDADESGELNPGTAVYVLDGTANAKTAWIVVDQGTSPIVPGTDDITFTQFGATGGGSGTTYTAGNGLSLAGTEFSVDPSVVVRKYAAAVGDGASTSIAVAHNLGTQDVTVSLQDGSNNNVMTDWTATDSNTVTLKFAVAPAASAYRVTIHG